MSGIFRLFSDLFDECRVVQNGLPILIHFGVKFCFDFEYFLEVLIHKIENIIDSGISDHDNLDVDIYGLWFEATGRNQINRHVILYLELLVTQCSLESWPNSRLDERINSLEVVQEVDVETQKLIGISLEGSVG